MTAHSTMPIRKRRFDKEIGGDLMAPYILRVDITAKLAGPIHDRN
jgi:hypothetical protein